MLKTKHPPILFVLFIAALSAYAQQKDSSFFEGFDNADLKNFRYGSTGTKAEFKWKSGVASGTAKGLKILSLKLDPEDKPEQDTALKLFQPYLLTLEPIPPV